MSLSWGTYVGPVVIATFTRKEVPNPYRGCGNLQCSRRNAEQNNSKFCNQCGEKIVKLTDRIKKVKFPDWQDRGKALIAVNLSEDALIEQRFGSIPAGCDLFMPNAGNRNQPRSFDSCEEEVFLRLTDVDIQQEKDWLKREYAQEIHVFESLYQAVEVGWIFMTYQS